jgi:DNA-binding PadR family transcriptional regulator
MTVNKLRGEITKSAQERALRSFLDLAILQRLANEPMSGYQITVAFGRKFGVSMSPGTVYSVLQTLEINGLIGHEAAASRKFYLTEKGKKMTKTLPLTTMELHSSLNKILTT